MKQSHPAVLFTFGVLALLTPFIARGDDELVRYYFRERQALALDRSRVAIRSDKVVEATVALRELGIDSAPSAMAIAAWWLVDVPPRLASDNAAIRALIDRLASDGRVPFVSPVFIGHDGGPVIVTPDLLVAFQRELNAANVEVTLTKFDAGAIVERDFGDMPLTYRLRHPSRNGLDVLETANTLAQRLEVLFAEPNWIFTGRGSFIPNDPGFPNCWGLHNTGQFGGTPDMDMDAPEAWDITTGDGNIAIVVIDVGVQKDHPDLKSVAGADFTGENGGGAPVNPCDKHGTPVAGCAHATINNGTGTVGIAPTCHLLSARTFISTQQCNGSWESETAWTVEALAWSVGVFAEVTNNSNFYGWEAAAITQKYADTRSEGLVHFAAAGNNGQGSLVYPAKLPSILSVAALTNKGERANFSNYGTGLDLSAPGVYIYSTDRTGGNGYNGSDYGFFDGTSFASPYAAGVAALVRSIDPNLTVSEVENILKETCVDLGPPGYDTGYGHGFVNARNALESSCLPPDMPTNVIASNGKYCESVSITWTPHGGDYFRIYRAGTNGCNDAVLIGEDNLSPFTDYPGDGVARYYWVRAVNDCGDKESESDCSNSSTGWAEVPLGVVQNVTASKGDYSDMVLVDWNGLQYSDIDEVWRNESDDLGGALLKASVENASEYQDHDVQCGKIYYYWVRGWNECGYGGFSSPAADGYSSGITPGTAQVNASAGDCGGVTVLWTDVEDAQHYAIFRNTIDAPPVEPIVPITDGSPFFDDTAEPLTHYWYWVQAVNACGAGKFSDSAEGWRAPDAPIINTQPPHREVCIGADVEFCIDATGAGALHYAWTKDGVPVGTDADCYMLIGATQEDDAAQIVCEVTDDCGIITSDSATLTVTPCNDCNGNGIDDAIDIANGISVDCNGDGTPDECQIESDALFAEGGAPGDDFSHVAVDGSWAIVGAEQHNGQAGAVYGFDLVGSTWAPGGALSPDDQHSGDFYGASVAMSGDLAVVGAPRHDAKANNAGAVYVFRRVNDHWAQEDRLLAPDGAANDQFGISVAISGDAILVGAWLDNTPLGSDSGSAYMFRYVNGAWTFEGSLTAADGAATDWFGRSVALNGSWVLIGAPRKGDVDGDGEGPGAAYVFKRAGNSWTQHYRLLFPDAQPTDGAGRSVAITPGRAWVGAPKVQDTGGVYVFKRNDTVWDPEAILVPPDGNPGDAFGRSLAFSSERKAAVVGAPGNDLHGPGAGAAYLFLLAGTEWSSGMRLPTADLIDEVDAFGTDCAIDFQTALVGAPLAQGPNGDQQGKVLAFAAGETCPECYPDLDGNGLLDLFDFLTFVNLFNIGSGFADCDQNGGLDLFDFLCFVNAFNEGC
jgi:hypothetical protein